MDSVDLFLDNDPEENLTSEATMIYRISLLPKSCHQVAPKNRMAMDGPWLIKYYQERHDPEKTWVALVQFLATSPTFSPPLHLAGDTSLGTKQLHFGGRGKAMLLEVTWSEVRQMAKRDARPRMSACFMIDFPAMRTSKVLEIPGT